MKYKKTYYGTREAAAILQVSMSTLYRMLKDGRLKYSRIVGNRVRIPAKQVEQYLIPIENDTPISINTTLQK